jgi:NADPH:quinone reductase-like Zn-dependent oxidoreductase
METMRAVRGHRRGGPEQLVYETAPRPVPLPGEVLVAVHAASITRDELTWDATWTDTLLPGGRDRTPIVPAHEMSGTVETLGPGVTDRQPGEAVYALVPFTRDGAAAEYVTIPADILAAKPRTLDHEEAAAVPMAGLTALQALTRHAAVGPGHHVLIHGAAGGVGSFAVQIAASLGAHVTATAGPRDLAFVKELGAEQVIDHTSERFDDIVTDVDTVLDTVGGRTQAQSWKVLRPGGVMVSIASPPDPDEAAAHGVRGLFFIVEPDRPQLETLTMVIDRGDLAPVVDRVLPLEDTRAAYLAVETDHPRGKVVIRVT